MTAFRMRSLVRRFANAWDVPVARHNGDTIDRGVRSRGTWTPNTITRAFITPYRPRQQIELPEGLTVDDMILVYVEPGVLEGVVVRTVFDESRKGDVLEWAGKLYQVTAVGAWDEAADITEIRAAKMLRPEMSVTAFVDADGGGG